MSTLYAVREADETCSLEPVWHGEAGALLAGCTAMATLMVSGKPVLFAFSKLTHQTAVYALSDSAPWISKTAALADLGTSLGKTAWDSLNAFVLGNQPYLMAYERSSGTFGFFAVAADLSLSEPYLFVLVRNTPTQGFTSVGVYSSLGQIVFTGYDFDTGLVANFTLAVTATSPPGVPPLLALNVWYHQWARGWTRFAFFQLGGANFFFKINTGKLNVNIDHMQDNPAMGSVEVGSYLQAQLPDALQISHSALVPWAGGDPMLITYIASSGKAELYRIHADCQGWTGLCSAGLDSAGSLLPTWRIKGTSLVLLYTEE